MNIIREIDLNQYQNYYLDDVGVEIKGVCSKTEMNAIREIL